MLAYSHDSVGLGHLRRTVTMASALVRLGPNVQVLCATGSPTPDVFELPERCEVLKVPTITKDERGRYTSRRLPLPFAEITGLRSDLLTAAVRAFRPDVLLVDHTARGPGDELLPVLRRERHEGCATHAVLGLRDVLDAPEAARAELAAGAFEVMRTCYDQVFVYGQREILDVVDEYGFPPEVAAKTTYVGMVVAPDAVGRRTRTEDSPHLLVTAGGGEDGYELLRGVGAALSGPMRRRELRATLVPGPLMPGSEVDDLRRATARDPRVVLLRSTREMPRLLAGADLVVGMGGYNTVYEVLSRGLPLLAFPRQRPRREQWERCRRLAARGDLRMLAMADLRDPHRLAAMIEDLLRSRPRGPTGLRFDGAETAAAACLQLRRAASFAPPRAGLVP